MLFDLRGRGRQRTVKVVYITLAFLMGGGLVLFGIGGNTSGGLVDAITGSGSSGDTGADRYEKDITAAKKKLAVNKKDEAAWSELIKAQVALANLTAKTNASTGTVTYDSKGKATLREADDAWKQFQAIEPKNKEEEARVASRMVQAYTALGDLPALVNAQEIFAIERDSSGPYAQYANYAYLAGQTRRGDLAAKKAIALEDPDQRNQLKGDLDAAKQQAAQQTAQAAASAAPALDSPDAIKEATKILGKNGKKKSSGKGDKPESDK